MMKSFGCLVFVGLSSCFCFAVDFGHVAQLDSEVIVESARLSKKAKEYISSDLASGSSFEGERVVHCVRGETGLSGFANFHTLAIVQMPRRFVHGITNTVYVAYHDSRLADDWISNFKVTPISAPYGMSGVVHSGFYDAARSSFEGLIKVLKDNVDSAFLAETEFVFTGHSLGGAMATWGCLHLHHNFDNIFPGANRLERHQIKIITFAAPKIGDSDFACSFDRCLKNDTLRFSCKADLVPCVPYRMCRSIGRQIDVYVADNAVEKIEQRTATPQNSQDAWQQFKWLHGVFGWLGNVFEEAGSEEESDEEEESDFEALKKVAKKVGAVGKEVLSLAHIVPGDDALLAAYKNFLHSLACAESPEDAEAAGRPLYWGPTNPLRRLFGI